jgi:hypothetical protein
MRELRPRMATNDTRHQTAVIRDHPHKGEVMMNYETSGMTVYKEVDGKLVIVANFEQGMDDDMHALTQNAALLYALEATHSVIEDLSDTGDLDREGTLEFLAEAIRKATG